MKHFFQTFISMTVIMLSSLSAKAYDFESEGIRYDITSFTELTASASSLTEKAGKDIKIPETIDFNGKTLRITSIGESFAANDSTIETIVVGENTTLISSTAFQNCSHLKSVSLKSTITIGSNAFDGCSSLEQIDLPQSVVSIGEGAFQGCSLLNRIDITNVKKIEPSTFANCTNLSNINRSEELNEIGDFLFKDTAFKRFSIPNAVKNVGYHILAECSKLITVEIGNGIDELRSPIFSDCPTLEELIFSDGSNPLQFTYITGEAKYESPHNPNSYSISAYGCFENVNLKTLYIGRNLKCGVAGYKVYSVPFLGNKSIEKVTIGEDVTTIPLAGMDPEGYKISESSWGTYVVGFFQDCSSIKSVNILGGSLTKLSDQIFQNCENLENITLGYNISSIGENAFLNCSRLEELTLGCFLKSIGKGALIGCEMLKTINLRSPQPPTYTSGFSSAIYLNSNLNVPFGTLDAYQTAEPWNNFWNIKEKDELISLFSVDGISYFVKSGNEVTIIGYDFSENRDLLIDPKITYANREYIVKSLDNYAFQGCKYIGTVKLNEGITSIGNGCFENCSLTEITLPYSLETIGEAAFSDSNICNIINLSQVSVIPYKCFEGCYKLKSIDSLDKIERIEELAFQYCKIEEFLLANIRFIAANAFDRCNELRTITLGSELTTIGDRAFLWCSNLSSIEIPGKVEHIGSSAFENCSLLEEIIFKDGELPLTFPRGSYDEATGILKKEIDGKTIQYKIEYYNSFFGNLRIKKLYIGRNLSNEPRYTMQGDGDVDYYLISTYDGPFSDLSYLSELTIGENVSILGPEEEYISEIGMYVTAGSFKKCKKLNQIMVHATIPPSGAEFFSSVYENATLTVPENTKPLYLEANGWKEFLNIIDGTEPILPDKIELNVNELSLKIGEIFQLTAEIFPENVTDNIITWTSSDESIVSVDDEGQLSAISIGEAVIAATCGEVSASCVVTVMPVLAEMLTISPDSWTGEEGESFTIEATLLPENTTDKALLFESNDESVAIVDQEGKVSVLKEGTCIITVSTVDGSNLSAKCYITGLAGIETLFGNTETNINVYNQQGKLLKSSCSVENLKQLQPGIYIVRTGNEVKKIVITKK